MLARMNKLLLAALAMTFLGCAQKDPYQDPNYVLKRNLRERNQRYDNIQNRRYLRREARDQRYQAWFNSVME